MGVSNCLCDRRCRQREWKLNETNTQKKNTSTTWKDDWLVLLSVSKTDPQVKNKTWRNFNQFNHVKYELKTKNCNQLEEWNQEEWHCFGPNHLFQSYATEKFPFKMKSNPLACDMGDHSVGKWDPIPRCGETRKPQPRKWFCFFSDYYYYYYFMIERETQPTAPLQCWKTLCASVRH